ncbi:riboflavin synthase [Pantanalinema sp. GBBB05]|uniref:riboflavin synthase n=1 Tax=Pantanalinema sp. GBBB05 TaxID=2604139 RepID=UPI001DD1EF9C|nr:riboflavin synthase [Pantanalinema sp. GBBB05]
MFTGLIQGLGTLQSLSNDQLKITCTSETAKLVMPDLAIGDSVAVDGVCLTVVEILPQGFVAVASPETRDRSTLGHGENAWVNLETSLRVGSKLGGHFVTGHVDGIGYLQASVQTATSWEMTFTTSPVVSRYVISKGSIAVNGVSLTVADCDPEGTWFMVAVIPHTYAETNLKHLHPGSPVNLEGDILGKYVEKFLRVGQGEGDRSYMTADPLTSTFLAEHGYL